MPPQKPLAGIRVLDLGRMFAAPWAGQMLGDLGAEVIKVERLAGDEMRHYGPPFLTDAEGNELQESAYSMACNRNKSSIAVDISKPEGVDLVRRLALDSDVLIENFKSGDLARRGLDYDSLKALKPELIYCSITGFGQDGPYASRPAVDTMAQAMSGMMTITGEPEGEPQKVGFVLVDLMTGLYAVIAVLAALRHREVAGGPGQHIDLALLDTAVAAMSHRAMEYLMTGVPPVRKGSGSAGNVPARNFAASDGIICVQAGGEAQFRKLCHALNRADLLADPRFATRRDRAAHEAVLVPILDEIFRTRTVAEWFDHLQGHEVFCAPLYDVEGCFNDPQVRHRGTKQEVPHASAGAVSLIANPIRFSETPLDAGRPPPLLGEQSGEVLREVLGLSDAEIDRLLELGVVGGLA